MAQPRDFHRFYLVIITCLLGIVFIQSHLLFKHGVFSLGQTTEPPITEQLPTKGQIAFIIDDWGYNTRNCHYLQKIQAPVAVAVLPHLAHTEDIVECAQLGEKELILHLPLEPHRLLDYYPEDYIIETTMSSYQIKRILNQTLDSLPQIVGVNNHMGSRATEDSKTMGIVFDELKRRDLFFVDSLVTPDSIAQDVANIKDVKFIKRDVFLDNKNTRFSIERQFNLLAKRAEQNGFAIAIGHDRSLTMKILAEQIPELEAQGFDVVSVKELLIHYENSRN